jgi:uncharacterized membrane protein HdeD (DUF308 family)
MAIAGTIEESFWVRGLLGFVLIIAGMVVMADVALVARVSIGLIGFAALAAGLFEVAHAVWTKAPGELAWRVLLGLLYAGFGIALLGLPEFGLLMLKYALGLALLISGLVRIMLAYQHWRAFGWTLLASGIFGLVGGIVILAGWPVSGVRAVGFVLGMDLVIHGAAWLAAARWGEAEPARPTGAAL